ncbi:MAG TPA: MarR family winged helix-turn-helix transcriptional regulator [Cytophagales bacterium]|nr:MarR family winged helix-turn-helix transcriptional regulator [Cytophagales bacterium]
MNTPYLPFGTQTFILSKLYYSVLSKRLDKIEIERYFSIMLFIRDHEGCTQQQICDALYIDKTAMVKIIDYLAKSGFVERHSNPNDRRQHSMMLTGLGIKRTNEIVIAFEELDNYVFSEMSSDQRTHFIEAVNLMCDRLKDLPANSLYFNYKKTK